MPEKGEAAMASGEAGRALAAQAAQAALARERRAQRCAEAARAKTDSVAIYSRTLRILIVEDHRDSAEAMRKLLALDGHDVVVAATVRDAERACRASPFTRLLCDIGLPDGSGLDLVRTVKTLCPQVRAIALSGYALPQDVERALRAGFDAHLSKPVAAEVLRSALA